MQLRLSIAIVFTCFCLASAPAWAGLRMSAGLGFGSSSTNNEVAESEGPLTQLYTVEYLLHSRLIVGGEHLRSLNLSPIGTSIAFTGIFGRYYFNAAPSAFVNANSLGSNSIVMRDICYFAGIGIGLAQSNLLPDEKNLSSNAAGIYLSPRGGAEMALTEKFGVRGEAFMGMTVFGSGTISSFSAIGSIYYVF